MKHQENLSFSQIVCSSHPVREAFACHAPTRWWWRLILTLHGKPVDASLGEVQRSQRIADGFRFYARLYRLLSIIFLGLAVVLVSFDVPQGGGDAYWAGSSFLAGVYLWGVSGLGYAGARSYACDPMKGTVSLLAFMVMIIAFLCLFVAATSVVAHQLSWLSFVPNLLGATLLFTFGIGSYGIEILYLVTQSHSTT